MKNEDRSDHGYSHERHCVVEDDVSGLGGCGTCSPTNTYSTRAASIAIRRVRNIFREASTKQIVPEPRGLTAGKSPARAGLDNVPLDFQVPVPAQPRP